MRPLDQRLFESDLQSAEYRNGLTKGLWGEAESAARPDGATRPNVYFWMAAAPPLGAPDRYYVALNLAGSRNVSPTGPLWDPAKRQVLELAKWPKGKPNTRFALDFRTDGFTFCGRALYHPYDRSPLSDHPSWPIEQPHLVWTSAHTIVN